MEYTGKLYGEGGIPLMLTASDVDALESMHSRLCAALGLPEDSAPEKVAEAAEARRVAVPEHLLHELAMAAWDAGADAGIVWCPDADRTKRGTTPLTPQEGLENSRTHFAKHGSGSPNSEFGRALQAIREHARAIPADRVLGEGMAALRRFAERCAQRDHQPDEHIGSAKCVACEAEDALRALQGRA